MRIAIIGAGFSGCQLAIELLQSGPSPIDILLFDSRRPSGPASPSPPATTGRS
jgi:glycine/D-amino acid oxidase-like deaminating enzyme